MERSSDPGNVSSSRLATSLALGDRVRKIIGKFGYELTLVTISDAFPYIAHTASAHEYYWGR